MPSVLSKADELFSVLDEFEVVFEEVTDELLDACYETNFSDFENFSQLLHFSMLELGNVPQLLTRLCGALHRYEQSATEDEIWEQLAQKGMKAQKLVVFIWYLIERGLVADAALEERSIGLSAAGLYMALCALNGSQAFNVFNAIIYQRTVDSMRGAYRLLTSESAGMKPATKGKRGHKKSANSSQSQQTTTLNLNEENRREVKENLFDALDSLFVFLNKVSLSTCPEVGRSTAELIVDVMRIDFAGQTSITTDEYHRISEFQSLRRFSERSFALMHRLIESRHSGAELVLARIVMPRLVFWTFTNTALPTNAHPTKLMNDYKDAMLRFIKTRVQKENKDEMDVLFSVLINVCHRCPDRSEYRNKVALAVCEALALMPRNYHYDFAHWISIFGCTDRTSWRGFAVEIVSMLLHNFDLSGPDPGCKANEEMDEGGSDKENSEHRASNENDNDANSDEESNRSPVKRTRKKKKNKSRNKVPVPRVDPLVALFTLMVKACDEKSSSVRARALVHMVSLLQNDAMRQTISRISDQMAALAVAEQNKDGQHNVQEQSTDSPLLNMLLNRCTDSKVSVRKAAVLALEACSPCLSDRSHIDRAVNAIKRACRDGSLLVRKQSAEALTRVMLAAEHRDPELVQHLEVVWLSSVMPMAADRENSVSQLVSTLIINTLISPILSADNGTAWRLLAAIEQDLDSRRSLLRALLTVAKEGNLSQSVANRLLAICDQPDKASVAWMLLVDLLPLFKVDPSRALSVWFCLGDDEPGNVTSYVAQVIGLSAPRLKPNDKRKLIDDLSEKLSAFKVDERHMSKVFWAYWRLFDHEEPCEQLISFSKQLLNKCCSAIRDVVFASEHSFIVSHNPEDMANQLVRIVASIGEVVLYDASLITDDLSEMIKIIFASDVLGAQLMQLESMRQTPLPSQQAFVNESETNGVQGAAQPLSQGTSKEGSQPTVNSQGLTTVPLMQSYISNACVFTTAVRARAVLTIGKMCLVDEQLAKKCVPVFVKQLVENTDHCVRCNIVAVVCDLCIRYTLLVDRYSAIIALSLRDRSTLVRKQALTMLTCLLKEQYIRWEGQIMYRFVSTLLDDDRSISDYAELCLLDVLLVQFPKMFEHHFVECLFYFNRVQEGAWAIIKATDTENMSSMHKANSCSLAGDKRREDRIKLYNFMLKTFNDHGKFTLMERICHDVFAAVAERSLDTEQVPVQALLCDCYRVMCSPEIRLTFALGERNANTTQEADDEPPAAVEAGAKRVMSQIFRRGIIESILPHIIQLRYHIQSINLPLCHEQGVILVLRELCNNHAEQLDEFLVGDPQLKEEIRFDFQNLQGRERAEADAAENQSEMSNANPQPSTPSRPIHIIRSMSADRPTQPSIRERIAAASTPRREARRRSLPPSLKGYKERQAATEKMSQEQPPSVECSEQGSKQRDGQRMEVISEETENEAAETTVRDVAAKTACEGVAQQDAAQSTPEEETHSEQKGKSKKQRPSQLHISNEMDQQQAVASPARDTPQTATGTCEPAPSKTPEPPEEGTSSERQSSAQGAKRSPTVYPSENLKSTPVSQSRPRLKKACVEPESDARLSRNDLAARAISTPTHAMDEVTFRLNDVSAILKSPTRRRSLRPPSRATIDEE